MIDFDAIAASVRERSRKNLSDNNMSKLAATITDAAIDATIAVLKEYEKQKSTEE